MKPRVGPAGVEPVDEEEPGGDAGDEGADEEPTEDPPGSPVSIPAPFARDPTSTYLPLMPSRPEPGENHAIHAIVQDRYGTAAEVLELRTIDRPQIASTQVLVEVHAGRRRPRRGPPPHEHPVPDSSRRVRGHQAEAPGSRGGRRRTGHRGRRRRTPHVRPGDDGPGGSSGVTFQALGLSLVVRQRLEGFVNKRSTTRSSNASPSTWPAALSCRSSIEPSTSNTFPTPSVTSRPDASPARRPS